MSATSSPFNSPVRKFLKVVGALNKKIHEATGKMVMGSPENRPAGSDPKANFRQVGSVPEDKSGFKVN